MPPGVVLEPEHEAWPSLYYVDVYYKLVSLTTLRFVTPVELVSPGMLQYAVGCRACLFVCSDLLAVSEFVFSLLWLMGPQS